MPSNDPLVIEHPVTGSRGNVLSQEYGVYRYGVYEDSSVLAGQQKRSFVDSFPTLAEAQAAYPGAEWDGDGYSQRVPVHIPDAAPAWFDPLAAGETWHERDAY
jgi:hypothetical protein